MRKCSLFLILLFLVQNLLIAQYTTKSDKAIKLYLEGRKNYAMRNYPEAESILAKAIGHDSAFQEPYMVLAEVYWDQQKYEQAIKFYRIGLELNPLFYPRGFLNKGNLEIKVGKYDDAILSYQRYLSIESANANQRKQAEKGIEQAKFGKYAVQHPVAFKPELLGDAINTSDDEYWPSLSADENTMVFTRLLGSSGGNILQMQEDFYISHFSDNNWSLAENAGPPLNTPDNEGAQTISANGRCMVYTVCNRKGVIGRCDLYISQMVGDKWTQPQNMGNPINTPAKETQPSLTSDGRTIYFVSDRPGTKGGTDIWVTYQNNDGSWTEPENLGDSINTSGNETSPFIHHDNMTLYFSSDYWTGMGGQDIFYSRRDNNGEWQKATNIGYPINTYRDEIGLIINAKGDRAYYSSDIDKTKGRDIYSFELYKEARPEEVSYLKGEVYDAKNHKVLKASFELYDLANGNLVQRSFSDPINGQFLICIPTNRNYMLNVWKDGYIFFSENFSLNGVFHLTEPFKKDVPLQPIIAGGSIILKNVFFDTDKYVLRDESKFELSKLIKFLETNSQIRIEISGHTDNVGSQQYNQQLSARRAKSVVDYLIANGIASSRLVAKGYGFSKSVDSNDTPEGRANNRRTELMIIN